ETKTGGHVSDPISDVVGRGEVESMLPGSLQEEGRSGLPATAGRVVRGVRAVVGGVDPGALECQQPVESGGNAVVPGFVEVTSSDTGLVGDHDDRKPDVVEAPDRRCGSGEESNVDGVGEVVSILDDRPVAVEENRRASRPSQRSAGGDVKAGVHVDRLPGDTLSEVGGEEDGGVGYLFQLDGAAERRPVGGDLEQLPEMGDSAGR